MKNVILLCLSTVNSLATKSEYSYKISKDDSVSFDAYLTNEAPTKAVISELNLTTQTERLDRVIMICSDKVKEKVVLKSGEDKTKSYLIDSEYYKQKAQAIPPNESVCISHSEMYKELIDLFVKEMDGEKAEEQRYRNKPIEFIEVGIPNFTEEQDVSSAVTEAANKVLESRDGDPDEEINLYIDFNGGQRYVAFMIVAIANLMKHRNVTIKKVMTMNYDNKKNNIVPIQNMSPVFESFDLIAGINEYVNYGRIGGLQKYFKKADDKIQDILKDMKVFSNNLQLCRTEYIMREKANLYQKLKTYISDESNQKKQDVYSQLFLYVLQDILERYEGLLNRELPDIIEWCVEREFVQQALTFCSEEMPGYFWEKKIFSASIKEKEEYAYFTTTLQSLEKGTNRLKNDYRDVGADQPSKYAYNWMIRYLIHSAGYGYKAVLTGFAPEAELRALKIPSEQDINEAEKCAKEIAEKMQKKMEEEGVDFSQEQIAKGSDLAKKHIAHFIYKQKTGRLCVRRSLKKEKMSEILIWYYLLKDQRNVTNHASGGGEDGMEWSYEHLCLGMKTFVYVLKDLEK